MSELINFRDFGGYPTSAGGRVRTDRLYRSGHFANLTAPEIANIAGMDFSLIVDLRYASERLAQASPWPAAYADRIMTHDGDRDSDAPHVVLLRSGDVNTETVHAFYIEFYRNLAFDTHYRGMFAAALSRMAESDGRVLIHCNAGKDRTGILAALTLHILGVAQETIFADFMLSSNAPGLRDMVGALRERIKTLFGRDLPDDSLRALLDVRQEYIEAVLTHIVDTCGSIEAYLDESGVDADIRQRLRQRLLTTTN